MSCRTTLRHLTHILSSSCVSQINFIYFILPVATIRTRDARKSVHILMLGKVLKGAVEPAESRIF